MSAVTARLPLRQGAARLGPHLASAVPGLLAIGLCLVWAADDGGYDRATWYWGALGMLALLCASTVGLGWRRLHRSRLITAAIVLFAGYTAWSYLSISWAQAPGTALDGSNKTLLYLIVFTLMALLPWTAQALSAVLLAFVVGVGTIAVVLLFRLASDSGVASLFVAGRLASPTGYINSTAALFTIQALTAIALATRRGFPGLLRGLLLMLAAASLQTAIIVQSRGWLFTLPLVAAFGLWCVADRLRFTLMAVVPVIAAIVPIHRLLRLYSAAGNTPTRAVSVQAGEAALLVLFGAFLLGTLLAWGDGLAAPIRLRRGPRVAVGTVLVAVTLAAGVGGLYEISDHHPVSFVSHQWNGFSHPQLGATSHFEDVGTSRYDFWRVAWMAFRAHPIGGLGQDNFRDYYYLHRHSTEEPQSPHSLEMRLLACTGIVGTLLFAGFFILALCAAIRARRRGPPEARAAIGAALLALVVWTVHGSIDWFWEMPALSGPALGFLAAATSVGASGAPETARSPRTVRVLVGAAGAAAVAAATVVLGIPFLSVRETALAYHALGTSSSAALSDLRRAARLDPLDPEPDTNAGTIALTTGQWSLAASRFAEAISRERGAWFPWLGAGLAASQLGDAAQARADYLRARRIDDLEPAILTALQRVNGPHPLTPAQAFDLITIED